MNIDPLRKKFSRNRVYHRRVNKETPSMPNQKRHRDIVCLRCHKKGPGCRYSQTCHPCRSRLGLPNVAPVHTGTRWVGYDLPGIRVVSLAGLGA